MPLISLRKSKMEWKIVLGGFMPCIENELKINQIESKMILKCIENESKMNWKWIEIEMKMKQNWNGIWKQVGGFMPP